MWFIDFYENKTLYSNRVTTVNKRIHTPPPFASFKVGMFVVFYNILSKYNIIIIIIRLQEYSFFIIIFCTVS